MKTVVVFGSTGTAGSGVVQACLADSDVSQVRAITRRPLGLSHGKLAEVICSDFAELSAIAEHLRGVDVCLYCLGISARKVSGEEEYREIHVTYPLAAAQTLMKQSPAAAFVYLSGAGTKRTSSMMWARVKAEAEDQLAQVGLSRHLNVRPAWIVPRKTKGPAWWLFAPLVDAFPALGIRADDLGRAMLRAAARTSDGADSTTLENKKLRRLVAE